MSDRPSVPLARRQLLGLAALGAGGALTWDVARAGGTVEVSGPDRRPDATDEEIDAYLRGCTAFGLDLLDTLVADDPARNVMISPLGLSGALAMTWAGARGETEENMRETIHYPVGQDRLHPAIGAVQYDLDTLDLDIRHREIPTVWEVNRFRLRVANALWGQEGYPFREGFIHTLEEYYGSGFRPAAFNRHPEQGRARINRWAARASDGHVEEMIPSDAIDVHTVFVVTNVVGLWADWAQPFDPDDTEPGPFTRTDGSTVEVPMMHQTGEFPFIWEYGEEGSGDVGWQVVELPYIGGSVSMVLVVPHGDHSLADLEAEIDGAWFEDRFAQLDADEPGEVDVTMPRFTFANDLKLNAELESLGMTTAFDAARANFSGMTDPPEAADGLRLDWVFHDTYVAVDEEGTVAVAVSAIGGDQVSGNPTIRLDRPFLFCIRERESDAVLFLGRVVDPSME